MHNFPAKAQVIVTDKICLKLLFRYLFSESELPIVALAVGSSFTFLLILVGILLLIILVPILYHKR